MSKIKDPSTVKFRSSYKERWTDGRYSNTSASPILSIKGLMLKIRDWVHAYDGGGVAFETKPWSDNIMVRGINPDGKTKPVVARIVIRHIRHMILKEWRAKNNYRMNSEARDLLKETVLAGSESLDISRPELNEVGKISCPSHGISVLRGDMEGLDASFHCEYGIECDWVSVMVPIMPELAVMIL